MHKTTTYTHGIWIWLLLTLPLIIVCSKIVSDSDDVPRHQHQAVHMCLFALFYCERRSTLSLLL